MKSMKRIKDALVAENLEVFDFDDDKEDETTELNESDDFFF